MTNHLHFSFLSIDELCISVLTSVFAGAICSMQITVYQITHTYSYSCISFTHIGQLNEMKMSSLRHMMLHKHCMKKKHHWYVVPLYNCGGVGGYILLLQHLFVCRLHSDTLLQLTYGFCSKHVSSLSCSHWGGQKSSEKKNGSESHDETVSIALDANHRRPF